LCYAALEHDPSVQIGTPRALFDMPYGRLDIAPDGRRFRVTRPTEDRGASEINLVENWVDELKRLVPR